MSFYGLQIQPQWDKKHFWAVLKCFFRAVDFSPRQQRLRLSCNLVLRQRLNFPYELKIFDQKIKYIGSSFYYCEYFKDQGETDYAVPTWSPSFSLHKSPFIGPAAPVDVELAVLNEVASPWFLPEGSFFINSIIRKDLQIAACENQ